MRVEIYEQHADNKLPEAKLFPCTWDTHSSFYVYCFTYYTYTYFQECILGRTGSSTTYSKYQTIISIILNVFQECKALAIHEIRNWQGGPELPKRFNYKFD